MTCHVHFVLRRSLWWQAGHLCNVPAASNDMNFKAVSTLWYNIVTVCDVAWETFVE
jgi:hypothetical protein